MWRFHLAGSIVQSWVKSYLQVLYVTTLLHAICADRDLVMAGFSSLYTSCVFRAWLLGCSPRSKLSHTDTHTVLPNGYGDSALCVCHSDVFMGSQPPVTSSPLPINMVYCQSYVALTKVLPYWLWTEARKCSQSGNNSPSLQPTPESLMQMTVWLWQ